MSPIAIAVVSVTHLLSGHCFHLRHWLGSLKSVTCTWVRGMPGLNPSHKVKMVRWSVELHLREQECSLFVKILGRTPYLLHMKSQHLLWLLAKMQNTMVKSLIDFSYVVTWYL